MGQGTILDMTGIWVGAQLTIVWKLVVMKKCTSASQEFLESSLNQEYYHPDWQPKVLWGLTRKLGPQTDLKLSTWQRFIRIQQNIQYPTSHLSCVTQYAKCTKQAERCLGKFLFALLSFGYENTVFFCREWQKYYPVCFSKLWGVISFWARLNLPRLCNLPQPW